jgi:hypothetical protein
MSERKHWVAHFILLLVTLAPLWMLTVLPLVDYPNHLARAYVAYNYDSLPDLHRYFTIKWGWAPYQGFYWLLFWLQHVVSIYTAGKIATSLTLILMWAGALHIHRLQHKQFHLASYLFYPLLYSYTLQFGFSSFLLAGAMGFFVFSWQIRLSASNRVKSLLALGALAAIPIYLTHVIGFLVWLGLSGAWMLTQSNLKRTTLVTASMIIPLVVFYFVAPPSEDGFRLGTMHGFGSIKHVVQNVLSPIFFLHHPFEPLYLLGLVGLTFLGFLRLEKPIWRYTILCGGLALLFPFYLFSVFYLQIRVPPFLYLLVVSCFSVVASKRYATILVCALLAFGAMRYGMIVRSVLQCDASFTQIRAAMREHVQPGEKLMHFLQKDAKGADYCSIPRSFEHSTSLAIIESGAYVYNLFTGMPPIYNTEESASYHYAMAFNNRLVESKDTKILEPICHIESDKPLFDTPHVCLHNAEKMLFIHRGQQVKLPPHWNELHNGGFFSIYAKVK